MKCIVMLFGVCFSPEQKGELDYEKQYPELFGKPSVFVGLVSRIEDDAKELQKHISGVWSKGEMISAGDKVPCMMSATLDDMIGGSGFLVEFANWLQMKIDELLSVVDAVDAK